MGILETMIDIPAEHEKNVFGPVSYTHLTLPTIA